MSEPINRDDAESQKQEEPSELSTEDLAELSGGADATSSDLSPKRQESAIDVMATEEGDSATQKNDFRFFKSRSGHRFVFDDSGGK